MKTKDFVEQVENMGYQAVKTYSYIIVYDVDDAQVASVSIRDERNLSVFDGFYLLVKLLMEYSETPIDEREDMNKSSEEETNK